MRPMFSPTQEQLTQVMTADADLQVTDNPAANGLSQAERLILDPAIERLRAAVELGATLPVASDHAERERVAEESGLLGNPFTIYHRVGNSGDSYGFETPFLLHPRLQEDPVYGFWAHDYANGVRVKGSLFKPAYVLQAYFQQAVLEIPQKKLQSEMGEEPITVRPNSMIGKMGVVAVTANYTLEKNQPVLQYVQVDNRRQPFNVQEFSDTIDLLLDEEQVSRCALARVTRRLKTNVGFAPLPYELGDGLS